MRNYERELDDIALSRASAVVVEWRLQSVREAGDIVRADPAALPPEKIVELGEVISGGVQPRQRADDIIIYKAVGVGLQDVALAAFAYRRIAEAGGAAG
jgi:ornithine cyclodeaminase